MLARLEAHVAEQQRFAANASHELRTPLAITQTLLDVARRGPRRATPARSATRLHEVNARAIGLTEALLAASRADQRTFLREPVDLSLLAEDAAETLLPDGRGPRRHGRRRPATTATDRRVTRPAAAADDEPRAQRDRPQPRPRAASSGSPPSARPGAALLTVENTGERAEPAASSATLAEPFQRAPDAPAADHAGRRPRPGHRRQHHPGPRGHPAGSAPGPTRSSPATVRPPAAAPTRLGDAGAAAPASDTSWCRASTVARRPPSPSGSRGVDRSSTRYIAATTRAPPSEHPAGEALAAEQSPRRTPRTPAPAPSRSPPGSR